MKLITWNIQWGLGTDGRVDLARIEADNARDLNGGVVLQTGVSGRFSLEASPKGIQSGGIGNGCVDFIGFSGVYWCPREDSNLHGCYTAST